VRTNTSPFRKGTKAFPHALHIQHNAPSDAQRFALAAFHLSNRCGHLKNMRGWKANTPKEKEALKQERETLWKRLKIEIHFLQRFLILHAIIPLPKAVKPMSKKALLALKGNTCFSLDIVIDYILNRFDMTENEQINSLEKLLPGLSRDIYLTELGMRPARKSQDAIVKELFHELENAKKVEAQASLLIRNREEKFIKKNAHAETGNFFPTKQKTKTHP